jgi:hypothetical protein
LVKARHGQLTINGQPEADQSHPLNARSAVTTHHKNNLVVTLDVCNIVNKVKEGCLS